MNAIQTQASCADSSESDSLSVEEALQHIQMQLPVIDTCEYIPLHEALGRVLAAPIISPRNVPAHVNSAMDGYAIMAADLPATGVQTLEVIGSAWAGKSFTDIVRRGQCVRIMTGAVMPVGTDTVVIQEHVEVQGAQIRFMAGEKAGQNVRQAGEDLAIGQVVLEAGKYLNPAELGLLASLGFAEVQVKRRLRVAFFSTGDELCSVGQTLGAGQVYDSNRYTLYGMLQRLAVDILDMGVVRDQHEALQQVLNTAAAQADVIISSGGVSVGETDFTKQVLSELGQIHFWKIAMKPGRPLAFGSVQGRAFFGLPGNPVAVMVAFYQFVQPALRKMQGGTYENLLFKARSLSAFKKKLGRTEFIRARFEKAESGEWQVQRIGEQGSGILRSMSEANCFIVLPSPQGDVAQGDWVEVQAFVGLV
ncbi:MAG: molybdopterin molybdotransferase MoeA [Thiotrichaceae bacterium]|nr:molybdopterin molybdotransferase MoeA [Thiotrichaceae bacterium]